MTDRVCPVCRYSAWIKRVWESGGAEFCAVCEARQATRDALSMETFYKNQADHYKAALESIAANGCCDPCQEAGRWAKAALIGRYTPAVSGLSCHGAGRESGR